jgi:hypothetical protein
MALTIGSESRLQAGQDVEPTLAARGHHRQHPRNKPAPQFARRICTQSPIDYTRVAPRAMLVLAPLAPCPCSLWASNSHEKLISAQLLIAGT